MYKKLLLTFFLLFTLIFCIYPTKKENIKLLDYCFSLEKIISNNALNKRKNIPEKINSLSNNLVKFGVSKTQGKLINKIIEQYKNSKDNFVIHFLPNNIYCLAGYWIEKFKPGTFESILSKKSNETINDFNELKEDIELFLNDINSEYKIFNKEMESLFDRKI